MAPEAIAKPEKKRKRESDGAASKPRKKSSSSATAATTSTGIKVAHLPKDEAWTPVIATTPGLSLPTNLNFSAYHKPHAHKSGRSSELLLHSSTHPRLAYTGREYAPGSPESLLKHYIGVLDEETRTLRIVEAKHMSIRSSLRAEDDAARDAALAHASSEPRDAASSQGSQKLSMRDKYMALGQEFGTKRAKKAIERITANQITPMAGTADNDGASSTHTPAAAAVLESMADAAALQPTRVERQSALDASKPRPPHNPSATTALETYTAELVVGEDMLARCKVRPWMDAVEADEAVTVSSRFVAHRIEPLAAADNPKLLKVCRYMLYVLEFMGACAKDKLGRKVPSRDVLKKKLAVEDNALVDTIKARFTGPEPGVSAASGGGGAVRMTRWHVDKCMAHLAACALIVDQGVCNISDLRDDLLLETKAMTKYFREVGAKVTPMSSKEREQAKMTAEEAANVRIARLVLPLDFPKEKRPPAGKR